MHLNVARTLNRSAANGPGERFVIWVQGCPLACPGCWNPDTWSFTKRNVREVNDLLAEILDTKGIEGVTFTGGEPFAQARALAYLGRRAQEAGLSVFIFTGYYLDELTHEAHRALIDVTDVVVDGRYLEAQRVEGVPWLVSSNQRFHFLTNRYSEANMMDAPEVEFHLGPDGELTITGFPRTGM